MISWVNEKKRLYYYSKLLRRSKLLFNKYATTDDKVGITFLEDLLSILIMTHKFNSSFDPLFDNTSPFTTKNIQAYKKCIPSYNLIIKVLLRFNEIISKKYIKYYKKLVKYNKPIDSIKVIDIHCSKLNNHFMILSLNDEKDIKIPIPLFDHLVKLYNTAAGDHTSSEITSDCLEKIWIVIHRYKILSSGNNQASILPFLKLKIKRLLNIKTELFGSPLNTSNYSFGSIFYDIDKYFGSLGNFFDLDIKDGYYEINPVFDKCIISKVFENVLKFLNRANNNKKPLLFLLIIPLSYGFAERDAVQKYLVYYKVFDQFKYIRFNRSFNKTVVSEITKTQIIILATDYVSNFVKYNYSKLDTIYKDIKKQKNEI